MIADTQLRRTDAFAIGMAKLEACLGHWLSVEHTNDRVDGVLLVFERGVKLKLHACLP
jgi:hypothetical protein